MLQCRRELRHRFERVWELSEHSKQHPDGPVSKARRAVSLLGWTWTSPWQMSIHGGVAVDFLDVSRERWSHVVRD
eukprot:1377235-Karenia_brevis.AAC.1